ncbi:peptidase MA family metallohydrolase [Caldanaerobius polysaccharolyticus]|uniref:peptidase MA family metallohydrolase n=1 Tax=Caldanaerobius polysaccharolyticus TaxID=44256 RepID=UPI00047989F6|nr:peptidase MA family metallohydrolase [Caldanaerobius polysaccharolyticus]
MRKIIDIILICLLVSVAIYTGLYSGKVVATAYPVYKVFQQNRIVSKMDGYSEVQTKHFVIKYTDADAKYVKLVESVAEDSYKRVGEDLGYYPTKKVDIIIFHSRAVMDKSLSLPKGDDAMGVYLNGVIGVLSPDLWIDGKKNVDEVFRKEGPVLHEYTHFVVDDIAKGNYPIWFTEGIALNEEFRLNNYKWGEGFSYKNGPYTVKELTANFNKLDEILAYKRSFEVVNYISVKYGNKKIVDILKQLGAGRSMDGAFEDVLNTSIDVIDINSR